VLACRLSQALHGSARARYLRVSTREQGHTRETGAQALSECLVCPANFDRMLGASVRHSPEQLRIGRQAQSHLADTIRPSMPVRILT